MTQVRYLVSIHGAFRIVNGEQENYACDISEVTSILSRNNITYVEGAGTNTDPSTEDSTEAPAPAKKSGLSTGALIGIIAGALAVIAAIVVIIIVATGKKSAPQAAPQAAPQPMPGPIPQAAPQKRAMLRSMSTQHGGQTFPVGSTPVMIGRDPSSCTIVYREGTAGVSGKHCQVQFDAGSGNFIITDLRSSYGTFLMNGTTSSGKCTLQASAGRQLLCW